jgi:hypothetical protein
MCVSGYPTYLIFFLSPTLNFFWNISKKNPEIGIFSRTGSLKYEIKMAKPRRLRFPMQLTQLKNT